MNKIVCYLCRGAKTIFGKLCAACAGNGHILTDDHYCAHCGAWLPDQRALCTPCLNREGPHE